MLAAAKIYVVVVTLLSVLAFVLFGIDKRNAVVGGRRVSEKFLHLFALTGGWPGSLLGQRYFRHKTIKLSFRLILWAIVLSHLCLIFGWLYLYFGC